jgi:hypothetical protein
MRGGRLEALIHNLAHVIRGKPFTGQDLVHCFATFIGY